MNKSFKLACIVILLAVSNPIFCQDRKESKNELAILAGIIQPILLDGGNFEVDFYTPKWVFNYSHGFSLEMTDENGTTVGDIKDQGLAIHIPYSTGFGVGYRFNKYFDVRLEPKWHKYEVYYDGTNKDDALNQVTDYSTFTLGVGAYFGWSPFEKQDNILNGIFTSTSIRYWHKVQTSLDNGEITYYNRVTGQEEVHEAANIGFANTPFIFNIAIGYKFKF